MDKLPKEVMDCLAFTFNNPKVQNLSNDNYKEYITAIATLSLSTLIANEGHEFVQEFCQSALNAKGELPIVSQVKGH